MSAQIIQFPRPYRTRSSACRRPFDRIHVLPGDRAWSEWWTIAGSHGWLHASFADAVNDAAAYAADYGPLPIEIDR